MEDLDKLLRWQETLEEIRGEYKGFINLDTVIRRIESRIKHDEKKKRK